jgi:hypothetical protein
MQQKQLLQKKQMEKDTKSETQLQPATDWSLVWDNLHNVILPDGAKSTWYNVIHNILPMN